MGGDAEDVDLTGGVFDDEEPVGRRPTSMTCGFAANHRPA
jgi:hypothetical protein